MLETYKSLWERFVKIIRAISWPSPQQIAWASFTVLTLSVIIGSYLLLLDSLFYTIRNTLIN